LNPSWTHFSLWCAARELSPVPASPALVGDYLSDLGQGYARSTLRRKVVAISRANRHADHPLDTHHPSIRDVLRGIGRTHGSPPKRARALATEEVQQLVATCDADLVGLRDRALLLVAFAGALRRSELCGIEVEHITWKPRSLELLIPRSKTDAPGDGACIGIPRGKAEATGPVRALRAWLDAAGTEHGPVFRAVTRHGALRSAALSGEAVCLILLKRARLAGIKGSRLEPISPHGLRAGFVTSAYRANIPDEEIMGHSRTGAWPPCAATSGGPSSATPARPAKWACSPKHPHASRQRLARRPWRMAAKPTSSCLSRASPKSPALWVLTPGFKRAVTAEASTALGAECSSRRRLSVPPTHGSHGSASSSCHAARTLCGSELGGSPCAGLPYSRCQRRWTALTGQLRTAHQQTACAGDRAVIPCR